MKKTSLFSIIALALFALASCKDKNAFKLSGTVDHPGSLKKVYLLAIDSSQLAVVDSANLSEQGKFEFKHAAPYESLFMIRLGSAVFDMIAKNGDNISFTTDLTNKNNDYTITGSPESDKMKEFDKVRNGYLNERTKIAEAYDSAAQAIGKSTDSLIGVYKPKYLKNAADLSEASLKFANDNVNSISGFYAIAMLEDPSKYEQQVIAYTDKIKGKFPDNLIVQRYIKGMEELKPISIGHQAPDFTVAGIDDKPIKLSDYKGKYLMIDFWASWCVPCRQENPNVVKQYAKFHPLGLNILGISLDQDKAKWKQAVEADKLTWSHGSDLKNFEGPTERLFHIESIPSNFIVDPNGIIVAKNITGADLEEFLNKTFSKSEQNVKIK